MNQAKAIDIVLTAFKDMGATKEELEKELAKLEADQKYLEEWFQACRWRKNETGRVQGKA